MALRATEHPMAVPDHTYDPGHKAPLTLRDAIQPGGVGRFARTS